MSYYSAFNEALVVLSSAHKQGLTLPELTCAVVTAVNFGRLPWFNQAILLGFPARDVIAQLYAMIQVPTMEYSHSNYGFSSTHTSTHVEHAAFTTCEMEVEPEVSFVPVSVATPIKCNLVFNINAPEFFAPVTAEVVAPIPEVAVDPTTTEEPALLFSSVEVVPTPVGLIAFSTLAEVHISMSKMLMVRTTSRECKAWFKAEGARGIGAHDIVNVDVLEHIAGELAIPNVTARLLAWMYFKVDALAPVGDAVFPETPHVSFDFARVNARLQEYTTKDGSQKHLSVKLKGASRIIIETVPTEARLTLVGTTVP